MTFMEAEPNEEICMDNLLTLKSKEMSTKCHALNILGGLLTLENLRNLYGQPTNFEVKGLARKTSLVGGERHRIDEQRVQPSDEKHPTEKPMKI